MKWEKLEPEAVEGAEVCIKEQSYEEAGGFKELEYMPGPHASLLLVFQGTLLLTREARLLSSMPCHSPRRKQDGEGIKWLPKPSSSRTDCSP